MPKYDTVYKEINLKSEILTTFREQAKIPSEIGQKWLEGARSMGQFFGGSREHGPP